MDQELRDNLAKLLESEGFPKDTTKKITNWNPYDQNASADFFDKEWMFNIQDGFDIILGNPPFIEQRKLKKYRKVFQTQYSVFSGLADIYVYFFEKAITLLKQNGILCYISSNKFIKTSYGFKLRGYLSKKKLLQIIDFTDLHVFDALVSTCIVLISNSTRGKEVLFSSVTDKLFDFENLSMFIKNNHIMINHNYFKEDIWQLVSDSKLLIKKIIENNGEVISKVKSITINRGITTGFNPAFIIDNETRKALIKEDKKSVKLIKPLLQGRNIKKWIYNYNDEYLIFAHRSFKIENFDAIYNRLKSYKKELENRQNVIRDEELWWQIPYSISYKDDFDKEKIIWGLTADKWAFAYDDKGHYLPSNGYILTSSKLSIKYLLALLNSKVLQFYFSFIGIMTAGGAYTLKHETISELPIIDLPSYEQQPFITLVDFILFIKSKVDKDEIIPGIPDYIVSDFFEQVLNGCLYGLYFSEEMKKNDIDILNLVSKELKPIDKMKESEKFKFVSTLYKKWQEQKNEIRNRILLMATRCPDTIGVIEESLT